MRHLAAALLLGVAPMAVAAAPTQVSTYKDETGQVQGLKGVVIFNPDGTVASLGGGGTGGGSTPTGTAGSPNTNVVTVQGISGGTPQNVNNSQVSGSAIAVGAGVSNAGTQRVILSSDSPVGGSSAVAQGSTTSGQSGQLDQGAVTATAPTYTSGQTSPLSITTAGGLRVDGSGVTQPVSGTVVLGAGTASIGGATAQCAYNSSLSTLTSGTIANPVQCDQAGNIRVRLIGGTAGTPNSTVTQDVFAGSYNTTSLGGFTLGVGDYLWNGTARTPTLDVVGAIAGAGAGVTATATIPTSAASQGITPIYFSAISAQNVKATAGNLFSWRANQASATGFIVELNLAAAPAASSAITPVACEPITSGSSASIDNGAIGDYLSAGITFVFSTSCTTYTSAGTVSLRAKVK